MTPAIDTAGTRIFFAIDNDARRKYNTIYKNGRKIRVFAEKVRHLGP